MLVDLHLLLTRWLARVRYLLGSRLLGVYLARLRRSGAVRAGRILDAPGLDALRAASPITLIIVPGRHTTDLGGYLSSVLSGTRLDPRVVVRVVAWATAVARQDPGVPDGAGGPGEHQAGRLRHDPDLATALANVTGDAILVWGQPELTRRGLEELRVVAHRDARAGTVSIGGRGAPSADSGAVLVKAPVLAERDRRMDRRPAAEWVAGIRDAAAAAGWSNPMYYPGNLLHHQLAPMRAGHSPGEGASGVKTDRPRILYVLHDGGGGTPQTNRDLMMAVSDEFVPLVLRSDTRSLTVSLFDEGTTRELERYELSPQISVADVTRTDYELAVADVLLRFGIDIVHVRHLLGHTLDIFSVASVLGVPTVLSLHDYYLICPSVHLLDHDGRYCAGTCTPGQGDCRVPRRWSANAPHLKHGWVRTWQQHVARSLELADVVVTTSGAARDIYQAIYPGLAGRIATIEHGRDVESWTPVPPAPSSPTEIRVLVPGNIDRHKGGDLLGELIECSEGGSRRIDLHFLGDVAPPYRSLGQLHGPYGREEFPERVRRIRPRFIAILSTWPETYSHTLTEAWAVGIPIVASDLGAMAERVRAHGGGWLVDPRNPEALYELLCRVDADETEYQRAVIRARDRAWLRSTRAMGDDYVEHYRRVLSPTSEFHPGWVWSSTAEPVGSCVPAGEVRLAQSPRSSRGVTPDPGGEG